MTFVNASWNSLLSFCNERNIKLVQFVHQLIYVLFSTINSFHSSWKITTGWQIEVSESSRFTNDWPAKKVHRNVFLESFQRQTCIIQDIQKICHETFILTDSPLFRVYLLLIGLRGYIALKRENYLRAGGVILVPLRLSEHRVSASVAWARWHMAISRSSAVKSWLAMSSSCSVWHHFWVTMWIPAFGADKPMLLLKYWPQNRHSSSAKSHTQGRLKGASINVWVFDENSHWLFKLW